MCLEYGCRISAGRRCADNGFTGFGVSVRLNPRPPLVPKVLQDERENGEE